MTELTTELPQAESADPDGVQVALRAAHTLWSNGETAESLRWLRRAAESASDEGADIRSFQLAKAAAELRAKLSRTKPAAVSRALSSAPSSILPLPGLGGVEPPLSERVVTATQYPAQRHREAPRPLMGISSATLERVKQRDSASPSGPPLSARSSFDEPKLPPEPPPLPGVFGEADASLASAWPAPAARPAEDVSSAAYSDPRTWSAEVPPSPPSAGGRWPPMSRAASGPPPLPEAAEPIDNEPEFLTDSAKVPVSGGLASSRAGLEVRSNDAWGEWLESPESARGPAAPLSDLEPTLYPDPASSLGNADSDWPSALEPSFPPAAANEVSRSAASESSDRAAAAASPLSARVHHQAVRVALAVDPRVPGQFTLRALRERESPLNGERVALLVALEPGKPLV